MHSFFFGTVMRGQPNHDVLEEARFVSEATTASKYRLLSVDDRYPAMVEDPENGIAINGELYDLTDELWQRIIDIDPEWMYRAVIELDDGTSVETMLTDVAGAEAESVTLTDISEHGGWRRFAATLS